MTPRQQKALAALLTSPSKAAAAKAAGIAPRTLRDYLADPEFQAAYRDAFGNMVEDATRQAQAGSRDGKPWGGHPRKTQRPLLPGPVPPIGQHLPGASPHSGYRPAPQCQPPGQNSAAPLAHKLSDRDLRGILYVLQTLTKEEVQHESENH